MLTSTRAIAGHYLDRLRARLGQRAAGIALALLVEALLVLVVLSMGLVEQRAKPTDSTLVSVTTRQPPQKAPEPPKPAPSSAAKPLQQPREPQPAPKIAEPVPAPSMPAIIPISRASMAALDISRLPSQLPAAPAPGRAMMGPPNLGVPGDSRRVGSAPNGEPMYAAAWYREPHDDELRGYLSTAQGPGWALIACRTVTDFRVEDCVGLDEYPSASQIQRAVLAAAWQFRVRPPRRGGVSRVGEWVRIRIEYTERQR